MPSCSVDSARRRTRVAILAHRHVRFASHDAHGLVLALAHRHGKFAVSHVLCALRFVRPALYALRFAHLDLCVLQFAHLDLCVLQFVQRQHQFVLRFVHPALFVLQFARPALSVRFRAHGLVHREYAMQSLFASQPAHHGGLIAQHQFASQNVAANCSAV